MHDIGDEIILVTANHNTRFGWGQVVFQLYVPESQGRRITEKKGASDDPECTGRQPSICLNIPDGKVDDRSVLFDEEGILGEALEANNQIIAKVHLSYHISAGNKLEHKPAEIAS